MNKNKGFTLVELIVVIVILGILAVVVIPAFSSYSTKANEATCATTRRTLLGELSAEQIFQEKKSLEEVSNSNEGKVYLEKAKCPSGGIITLDKNQILCSKHGKIISESSFLESFIDLIKKDEKLDRNDVYRAKLFEQYPDGWPAVVLEGKVLYMQPYLYHGQNTKLIFANGSRENKQNWNADAIYDEKNDLWYVRSGKKAKSVMIVDKTPEQVIAEIIKWNEDIDKDGKLNTENDWTIVKP